MAAEPQPLRYNTSGTTAFSPTTTVMMSPGPGAPRPRPDAASADHIAQTRLATGGSPAAATHGWTPPGYLSASQCLNAAR